MKKIIRDDKVRLYHGWDEDLLSGGLSVPGLSSEISLLETCDCVERAYDAELDQIITISQKDCCKCHGTGIEITYNGRAILTLLKVARIQEDLQKRW